MPLSNLFSSFQTILGILLIFVVAVLQGLGFCQPLEKSLRQHLPPRFLPESPRVILLSLESGDQGYRAIDIAMVLRGLGLLHPRCVIVDGAIELEQGTVPFLPNILSRMQGSGIFLILPQCSAPASQFEAISLIHYEFRAEMLSSFSPLSTWPKFEGKALPGTGNAFLPMPHVSQVSRSETTLPSLLPLLAKTTEGSTIGSLWWSAIPSKIRATPLLLFGKILLLDNHTPLHLTPSGEGKLSDGRVIDMPLDDFLLHIEQKEQGSISPSFDSLWKNATVVLGTPAALPQATALATLLEETTYAYLSLWAQTLIMLSCITIFFLAQKLRGVPSIPRWLIFLTLVLITLLLSSVTFLYLQQGIMIPFLPGIITALLVLIFRLSE